ncbi:MAG: entericidin A/B family lipoprotein [Tepidisphaeraceae bacterium]
MTRVLKLMLLGVIASVLVGSGFACNTMEGVGKDTKAAGQGIENTADNNK